MFRATSIAHSLPISGKPSRKLSTDRFAPERRRSLSVGQPAWPATARVCYLPSPPSLPPSGLGLASLSHLSAVVVCRRSAVMV